MVALPLLSPKTLESAVNSCSDSVRATLISCPAHGRGLSPDFLLLPLPLPEALAPCFILIYPSPDTPTTE